MTVDEAFKAQAEAEKLVEERAKAWNDAKQDTLIAEAAEHEARQKYEKACTDLKYAQQRCVRILYPNG